MLNLILTGTIASATVMLAASFAECRRSLAVVCFIISTGLLGCFISGIKVNSFDLAPNYVSTLVGVTNSLGLISACIAPYIVGVMTPNVSTPIIRELQFSFNALL